jgi:hypothetical protein
MRLKASAKRRSRNAEADACSRPVLEKIAPLLHSRTNNVVEPLLTHAIRFKVMIVPFKRAPMARGGRVTPVTKTGSELV